MKHLLVVDDEPIMGDFLTEAGSQSGFAVTRVDSLREARDKLGTADFSAAFLDIRLPDGDGLSVITEIRAKHARCHICVITAYGTVDTAVAAMKLGADDFLLKPFSITDVERVLQRVGHPTRRDAPSQGVLTEAIVTTDVKMKELLDLVGRVAPTDASILITGESGTGKELIARSFHLRSLRKDFPFVAVNCAAIPENLLEAELFGYEKGAFTGADRRKFGLVEIASGGTLFLDEIADMPMVLQPKILRVLEGGEFRRVGSHETLRADIRVVAATNKNLLDLTQMGQFRDDLYYRLSVIPIEIPPLRRRPGDVDLLADHFLRVYAKRYGKSSMTVTADVLDSLRKYSWPGNVRELENVIQRAVALASGDAIASVVLVESPPRLGSDRPEDLVGGQTPYEELVDEYERRLMREAMRRTRGNQTEAAKMLGLKRTTLLMKLKKFGMESGAAKEEMP